MVIWLNGLKIILYSWFIIRVLQKTPLSFPLLAIVLVLLISGFLRSFYKYAKVNLNIMTLLADLILVCLFSLFPKSSGFDKLFMIYLIEGTAILPSPFFIIYAILATTASVGSYAFWELRHTGQMQLLGIAEIMLFVLAFTLVLSERRQREQKLAYEKLSKELECVNLQLNESMVLSERLASEAERRRIAGEIHDSLGHDLTGLILTLEAGKKVMNHDVEAAKNYWEKAIEVSRKALGSIRELVSEKRETYFEFALIPRLNDMAQEVLLLTGLQIELDINTQGLDLSSKEKLNLYRIFQEAVTNTMRHTNANRAQISISGNQEVISFSYWDNGAGINKIEAGNGIKGMYERIKELDGDIAFQSQRNQGFKISGYINRRRAKNEED